MCASVRHEVRFGLKSEGRARGNLDKARRRGCCKNDKKTAAVRRWHSKATRGHWIGYSVIDDMGNCMKTMQPTAALCRAVRLVLSLRALVTLDQGSTRDAS